MTQKIIQQGAEAVIYKIDNKIVKDRIVKKYRFPELDNRLRKSRTKSEAKIISKLKGVVDVPEILADPGSGRMIHMEFIDGLKLSENLEKVDWKKACALIGKGVAKFHDMDIVHGDLTTSNMILKDGKVYFIDFGLGFHSYKVEDKAVDLHLLKQALNAKHFEIAEKAFAIVLKNYKANKSKEIINRIEIIESRGRYKDKH